MGRVGRAGKHTEGSIIFTETELFDDRRSSKRWHWNQIHSLLDPSQSEQCLSSLLTLVQPFQDDHLDVDPIKFIENPDKYEELVTKAIERQGDEHKHLLGQMAARRSYIKSLESFILANSDERDSLDNESISNLYSETLAYSLGNADERRKLAYVFGIVATKVNQIAPQKRPYFGKALLGIDELSFIETWLQENIERLSEITEDLSLLDVIWDIVEVLTPNNRLSKLIGNDDASLMIAKLWCNGVSYSEILEHAKQANIRLKAGTQERELVIENIIDICDSSLGYDAMLIVGACADLLENIYDKPKTVEAIRHLQTSLKIGLNDKKDIWLYSRGIADRVVAQDISTVLNSEQPVEILDDSIFDRYRDGFIQRLSKYPSVFYRSIYGL